VAGVVRRVRPLADRLYDEHLAGLWREGELR
jgi:hypothetical protein